MFDLESALYKLIEVQHPHPYDAKKLHEVFMTEISNLKQTAEDLGYQIGYDEGCWDTEMGHDLDA